MEDGLDYINTLTARQLLDREDLWGSLPHKLNKSICRFYFTEKVCKNGHKAPRLINRNCAVCNADSMKNWYINNKEKSDEKNRKWLDNNRERKRATNRLWLENNKEKARESINNWGVRNKKRRSATHRIWYLNNRERKLKQNKEWTIKNRHSHRELLRLRRKKFNNSMPKWLTYAQKGEIERIYTDCREISTNSGIKYHVDHIVPIQHENVCGLHVPWNLRIITAEENRRKSNKFDDWEDFS